MSMILFCQYLARASQLLIGTFFYLTMFSLYLADLGTIHIVINIDQYDINIRAVCFELVSWCADTTVLSLRSNLV
jgi:hypothetical protein